MRPLVHPLHEVFESGDWPFGPGSHDIGWSWMFDMAVVGSMLRCRPGDRVLDVGSGTGFATEVLTRFGYRVVAIDPDREALAQGRRRLGRDARLDPSRAGFAAALVQALPFEDASFDGAVGMNVLHHVDDLDAACRELARVLRPGARAAFSEPGTRHLESPQTQRAMREWGEDDKPFDVVEFAERAWRHGFASVEVRPLPVPELVPVEVRELESFALGVHREPFTRSDEIARYVREYHPLFCMVREGGRPRTSREPGGLEAGLTVHAVSRRVVRGGAVEVTATAENRGQALWLAAGRDGSGHVTLGGKLVREDGRLVTDELGRIPLAREVGPGGEIRIAGVLAVPPEVEPGRYRLVLDLVAERVCWFSDRRVEPPPSTPLEITAGGSQ